MNKKLNNILISNDDGYKSIGLELLLNIAEQLADNIFVVSPKKNQSAKSKSITIKENIQFKEISKNFWIVDGTPTGNRAITTPTAAEIISALGTQSGVGQCFELTIVNKATSTHKFTLTAGSGVTIVGEPDVTADSSGTFIFRVSSSTAVSAFRK